MAFNWVEGTATVKEIIKALATDLTTASTGGWTLEHPATLGDITEKAIMSTETTFKQKFYLQIEKAADVLNYLIMQMGTELTDTKEEIKEGSRSEKARFAWYRETDGLFMGDWLPVRYWLSFNQDFINIVAEGDASPDVSPYNHYLISYAYVGAVESYEGGDADDKYNFMLTAGSNEAPTFATTYGQRTGTGTTDIIAVGTRTGVPYQAHYTAFQSIDPWMDKNYIQASNWTHKHHFSEVTVVHAVDRERGKLQNLLIGDRSAIFHLDELIKNKGTDEEEVWKMFNINAPYSFINNSANVLYGIAIRKS